MAKSKTEDTVEQNDEQQSQKRPELPEGIVTPIGFAKAISEREVNAGRREKEVRPQAIYSYIRNATKEDPFPVMDGTPYGRKQVLYLQDGFDWWDRKTERVANRSANAEARRAKKQEKAASGEEAASPEGEDFVEVEEAE